MGRENGNTQFGIQRATSRPTHRSTARRYSTCVAPPTFGRQRPDESTALCRSRGGGVQEHPYSKRAETIVTLNPIVESRTAMEANRHIAADIANELVLSGLDRGA
jgi:hypothetical protein